ncbi:FkbM family methyltransferase [Chthonobacter rhizosphaerae]|uniref:FkbM family methyltransferase n=1 Tax=Chthonobacter rhizosphaerae TaxID=2735553 RepID=UPI0015EE7CC5|nr:FkbM family methyltransferase [Chthonobacter rhizosphaerae]
MAFCDVQVGCVVSNLTVMNLFWSKNSQLRELIANLDTLRKQVEELEQRNAELVSKCLVNSIDPYFRYQNELLLSYATFFSSEDKVFEFSVNGTKVSFYLPFGASDKIQNDILRTSNFYQPKAVEFINREGLVRQSSTVVDAGANIGSHSIFFAVIMGARKIYAFEPNPPAYGILTRNVELNKLNDRIDVHKVGLGDENAKGRNLGGRLNNLGGNRLKNDESGDVLIRRLDDFAFPQVDLIKIDVEGRGDGVIRGAIQIIERDKPIILIEQSSEAEKLAVLQLCNDFGYRKLVQFKLDVVLVA